MATVEHFANRLEDPGLDLSVKVGIATDLRDSIEYAVQGQIYPIFLTRMVPLFLKLLEGPPVFVSTSLEQRLRNCILEIFHRLPRNPLEALEPYAVEIVDRLMNLMKIENEENAILCMKICMDFQRHYARHLVDRVQPLLDLILLMFRSVEEMVKETFDNYPLVNGGPVPSTPGNSSSFQSPRPGSPIASLSDFGIEQQTTRLLPKGMRSFKLLAECPIIVVSLFQSHRGCITPNVKRFVPFIKSILLLQAKPQELSHAEAARQGKIFTGVSPQIKNRVAYGEFITAQVKIMSFLAYLLRVCSQQLEDFLLTLPDIVVRLLKDCPTERSTTRKELLVAIRHIINYNFRRIFLDRIDDLLNERILIGDALTAYETMRPLAYSMLADLIHHVRDDLKKPQIRLTIEVYTKNFHDELPGTSFQTMSARLLLNMADCITHKLEDKRDARHYLVMILNAIGDKFASMNRQYHNAVKLSKLYAIQSSDAAPEDYLAEKDHPPDWDEVDIFTATPIKITNPRDRGADPVADNKFLFKNLMNGLKNLFYQLKACNPEPQPLAQANMPSNWHEVSYGYEAEEVKVITKLFREGARMFRYYSLDRPPLQSTYSSPSEFLSGHYMLSSGKEEKELMETFATVFHCIDTATFYEVFHSEIPALYEMIFEQMALLHIPQFFLASEATSPSFTGMLLQFLVDRLEDVGSADVNKSSILLKLFKLSFMAVTLFATQNEQILLPHVTKILTRSIELSTTAEVPINYFILLRSLFRSIGGGRFELLYKEILPLLEMLLEALNSLLTSARKPQERDLYVELCLTVPARLSNLLPHLSYLMRPLVVALTAGLELVSQGLRTLELCVDNLTADYLDPIMAPVMHELMSALWSHLRPAPYSHYHSHTTMRILGKLGGRNRRFLNGPPSVSYRPYSDEPASVDVKLLGAADARPFPANLGLQMAIGKLTALPRAALAQPSDHYYQQQAFRLVSSQLKLHIGVDILPDDFAQQLRLQANDLSEGNCFAFGADPTEKPDRERSVVKKREQEQNVKELLKACIFAVAIPELKAEASAFLADVCRHFTVLEVGRALAQLRQLQKPFDVASGEGPMYLDSTILTDVIGDVFSSERPDVREAALDAVQVVHETAAIIFGSRERVSQLPFFGHLGKTFCHNCFEEEWSTKAAGCLGIQMLISKISLGDIWLCERQSDFVRSLMYVIKDLPQDLPAGTRTLAQETMEVLLRRCNQSATREDLTPISGKLIGVCGYFVYELSHMSRHVRETSQRAFRVIAEVVGVETYELVVPVKERLLSHIYNKPLRALPFATQIGYIDAVNFCLGLQHGIVEFNEQANRLLAESLALADSDDDVLAAKPGEHRTAEMIMNLRISCIRLLSTALSFPDFGNSPQNQTRSRVIAVFFKLLYCKSSDVVEAANAALTNYISHNGKLPRILLQNGLKPILMNLRDHRRLSVAGLESLAKLLTLLTTYFKYEIGAMLLEHLETIADINLLQRASFTLVAQSHLARLIAAILNIFHLLPPAAIIYLPPVVNVVLDLEIKLRRTQYSPFREPLAKFVNRYPRETWVYILDRMHDLRHGRLFAQMLDRDDSEPLRKVVMSDVDGLLKAALEIEDDTGRSTGFINAIHIVHSILQKPENKDWVLRHDDLRVRLAGAAKDLESRLRADALPVHLRLAAEQAGEHIIDIYTLTMSSAPRNLDILFEVIEAVTAKELKPHYSLFKYIYEDVVSSDSVDFWRAVVLRCLDLTAARTATHQLKTFAFHYLVNPVLAMDILRNYHTSGSAKGSRLVDKSITEAIHNKIWKPYLSITGEEANQPGVDRSRLELLQMSAMLIKYHHSLILDVRKDIIKFGWTTIRLEDIINKHAAYVVVAYFIACYDSPPRIVIQVYVALLRAYQNEGRSLVTQALELIAGVLPRRVPSASDARSAPWIKWTRRMLTEESANLQQTMSIYYFLVRHPELFYESRDQLIPSIVQSLSRIAPPSSPSMETKKLVLNLIDLIWRWEERRVRGTGAGSADASVPPEDRKRPLDGPPGGAASPASGNTDEYTLPANLQSVLIKYLVQFIITLPERYPVSSSLTGKPSESSSSLARPPEMIKRALQLLYNLLSPGFWVDLELDLFPRLTESVLATEHTDNPDERLTTHIANTLQVIRILVNAKPVMWIVAQLTQLEKLLEKPLRSEDVAVQECLHGVGYLQDGAVHLEPTVKRILYAIPEEEHEEDEADPEAPHQSEFMAFLSSLATEALTAESYISGINILCSLSERKATAINPHVAAIMKAFSQRLVKDCLPGAQHAVAQAAGSQSTNAGSTVTSTSTSAPRASDPEVQIDLALKAIDLLALGMAMLADQRRPFLTQLASLIEKAQDNRICTKILDLAEKWVFDSTDAFPTLKEKTAVLVKMLTFEARPDPSLLTKFLDLVIRIYEDSGVTRSELTVRLEQAFLIGTRAQDPVLRNRFINIFDHSLSKTARSRLSYIVASQNWDTLADSNWLSQAGQLIIGSIELGLTVQLHSSDFTLIPASVIVGSSAKGSRKDDLMLDDAFLDFTYRHRRFCTEAAIVRAQDLFEPLSQLQHVDVNLSHDLWIHLFPLCWATLSKEERMDTERGLSSILTKDYQHRQIDKRPNVVLTLLEGAARSIPVAKIPPHILKFLSRTYGAWYTGLTMLEESAMDPAADSCAVRESNLDALVEVYANLQEDDLFYGTWRRRCQFIETNSGLSYEQNGMWDRAQQLYEAAQIKARTGALPFSEAEYMLWEDHWVLCAQKLQQWDILYEFAKHENYNDLLLECAWRQNDPWHTPDQRDWLDTIVKSLMDAPTPRRSFFQAFMSLLRLHATPDAPSDFTRTVDEAVQLSIRKWHQLPPDITNAHIPILHNFQELVELHDAHLISNSLSQTNQQNLDVKSQELKLLLGTWRDRLPNIWDDINVWQDLVTWRQHIFTLINNTYLTLVPQHGASAAGNSSAYRGYHETAWIINRFAHVARKHQLPEVCISQLGRIYTLPNIEIQEAFLKLREQAKCHYQNSAELTNGLTVINNTNLGYFGPQQKAEFFTLKGMFLAKLNHKVEANEAYGTALYYDIKLPKAWAEWGRYNDDNFKDCPSELSHAASAVSCYLEAAGLFKSAKSRKLLSRILWLLSLDDDQGTLMDAYDAYKGETPVWYWIIFLPQLLTSLSHKEAKFSRAILVKVAKVYPQALYFLLRTSREDMAIIKRQQEAKERSRIKQDSPVVRFQAPVNGAADGGDVTMQNGDNSMNGTGNRQAEAGEHPQPSPAMTGTGQQLSPPSARKYPWELTEEIMAVVKTAFPLLALSMETMVDQVHKHFKNPPDEEAYRLIVALLNDGLAYVNRTPSAYAQDMKLPAPTEANISRFAETVLPTHIRAAFEADFVVRKPTMLEYIQKLRRWRDKFEEKLDRRPPRQNLEHISPHLSEFRFQKFDDVEVPGQYLQHKDKNTDFVRIERFISTVDLVRGVGVCYRRLRIRGHDGSVHVFAVQHPAARHVRREERIVQLFRIFNSVLARKKESRRRKLSFHLPLMIPLAPHIRLVQDDASYITLQGIYEDYCRRRGTSRDEPILLMMDKMRLLAEMRPTTQFAEHASNVRLDTFSAIQHSLVPGTVALEYLQQTHASFSSFWLFRRQFAYQLSALTFMTYIMHINNRFPSKLSISRATGNLWGSELIPAFIQGKPYFHNPEPVPFRLTPNLQLLLGPLATEGIFSCAVMSLARCLTEPEFELEANLSIFVRDEMIFWLTQNSRSGAGLSQGQDGQQLREIVQTNSDLIVKKAASLAHPAVGNLPVNQTVIDLVARAVDPKNLAQSDHLWMPWL